MVIVPPVRRRAVPTAEEALEAGGFDLAAERYQAILNAEPANTEAQLALRQVGLLRRLAVLPSDALHKAVLAPDDVEIQLAAADAELAANQVDAAFNRLLGLVRRLRGEDRMPGPGPARGVLPVARPIRSASATGPPGAG